VELIHSQEKNTFDAVMKRFPYSKWLLRLVYVLRSWRHIHGHGIHSPHVFGLVTDVLENRCSYYALEEIARLRMEMVCEEGFRQALRRESLHAKDGELLFRLGARLGARRIVVVGDFTGLASLYASGYASSSSVFGLCPEAAGAENAVRTHLRMGRKCFKAVGDGYAEGLRRIFAALECVDFLFLNPAGEREGVGLLFEECVAHRHEQSVFVVNDIRESRYMYGEWKRMAAHPEVSVAVELCRVGILFFNKRLYKHTYTLYY